MALISGLGMFAFWAWRARLHAPYADDHDWMELALQQGPALTFDYLLQPHNQQHIVWARLMAWLARGGGENALFLSVGVGLNVLSASALGRVDELPQPIVPARYVVFADMLHVGLLFACAPWLAAAWARRPRTAEAAVATTCVLMLAQQPLLGRKIERAANRVNAASAAFDRGDRSKAVVGLVYPPGAAPAERIRRELKFRR